MNKLRKFIYGSLSQKTGFFVRATGHFILGQKEVPKYAPYAEIFWCIGGSGVIRCEEQEYVLEEEMIFYFPPGSTHDITPRGPGFDYRWLSIDGAAAGLLFDALNIAPGLNRAGPCPDKLFRELGSCLEDNIPEQQLCALQKAFEILVTAVNPGNRKKKLSLPEKIKDFLDENYPDHDVNINFLSARFNLHRVTLCRQFQAQYGVTPIDYLISLRLHKAVVMLKETDLTIQEIALQCGFYNANYMAKVMKKNMSTTPRAVRKEY